MSDPNKSPDDPAKDLGDAQLLDDETDDNAEVVDIATGQVIDGYTKRDQRDMARMGKQQELMRNFRRISSLSFTAILTATWEYILM
jgi:hypothetical protein